MSRRAGHGAGGPLADFGGWLHVAAAALVAALPAVANGDADARAATPAAVDEAVARFRSGREDPIQ